MNQDLIRWAMSAQLDRPTEPKVFCKAHLIARRTGYTTSSCSFHIGHENDHRDVHTGATWTDEGMALNHARRALWLEQPKGK